MTQVSAPIQKTDAHAMPIVTNPIIALIEKAIEKGTPTDQINKLIELRDSWELNEARKKYLVAFTGFQSKCPVLKKKSLITTSDKSYSYATLGDIVTEIKPILKEFGLSYRWEIALGSAEEALITCSCVVSHMDGHYEETTISAEVDSASEMNKIQQRGSTIAYLHRLTLISALGLSTGDEETDKDKKTVQHNGKPDQNSKATPVPKLQQSSKPTQDSKPASIPSHVNPRVPTDKTPLLPQDEEKIKSDIWGMVTEREIMDYFFCWPKYINSVLFADILKKKISTIPLSSRLTASERKEYKKPSKITVYE